MTTGTTGTANPDLDTFRTLAKDRRVIPVTRRLLADGDTPVGLYRKLADERPGTFLLESAENGRTWSRYSFIGVRSAATLTTRDGQAHWLGTPPVGVPTDGDPLAVLRATVEALHTPRDLLEGAGLPPFTGGMVGYLGYDIVRRLEKIGEQTTDDLRLPELTMLLTSDLAVLDHWNGTVLLIANAINHNDLDTGIDEAYADAVARLDTMADDLARPPARERRGPAALRGAAVHRQVGRRRVPGGRRGHQGAHPGRRGLPGGALPALRNPLHGKRAGRLPRAARDQPQPVHVPLPLRGRRRRRGRRADGLRRGRLQPRGAGQGRGRQGDGAPHRRHPAARRVRRRRTRRSPTS